MTAEIVLLNPSAVAMAADSAATVRVASGGSKIFSANKLFNLASGRPLGVMVYASSAFMGLPWETLIKEFRKSVGRDALGGVHDYATRLIDFIQEVPEATTEKACANYMRVTVHDALKAVSKEVGDTLKPGPGVRKRMKKLREVLEQEIQRISKEPRSTWMKRIDERSMPVDAVVDELLPGVFPKVCFYKKDVRALYRLARLHCSRVSPHGWSSGLVVAGFGDDAMYPELTSFAVEGMPAKGALVARHEQHLVIGPDRRAAIVPFAQSDMVYTFTMGVDPVLDDIYQRMLILYQATILERVRPTCSTSEFADLEVAIEAIRSDFAKASQEAKLQNHVWPILDMLAHLPKDEIAQLAEALVALTSLKRRISRTEETVGGPTDVAVVSKGDGFVWVKRKHYFQPEMNLQFVANKLNNGLGGLS